jgi:hypothetical protein
MVDGLGEGTSSDASLNVAAAGKVLEGLLSKEDKEDKQPVETPNPTDTEEVEAEDEDTEEGDDTEQQTPDEDEDDVDDEVVEPIAPAPRKLKVKLPEGEQELPEDEVVKGYLRNADYTRKSQENAEKRKALDSETQAVAGERQRYATQLTQLDQILTESAGAEPDWDTLRNEDPGVFAATYAAWDQHQKRIASVRQEKARVQQQVQADQVKQLQEHLKGEAEKLIEAIPEWKVPEKAQADKSEIAEYARSQGYSDDEMNSVMDHRVIKILRDAMLFRKSQQKKPVIEKRIETAKVLAPGSGTKDKVPVSERTRRKQALAKTHSLSDAGGAIALMLDD